MECRAAMMSGCWIAAGLADDKGQAFADMVIASGQWSFPRVSIEAARLFLAENGEHCRCAMCRPKKVAVRALPVQIDLF